MLRQLGVSFEVAENTLSITGGHQFESCTIDAHNDHRIVMAAAIAGLNAKGPVTINGAEAVAKSYPDFFSHLSSLGAQCSIINE
jgi:3-phosphoshikimate 1-carboxyvinyltransferase